PWPPISPTLPNFTQLLTFYKDDVDFSQHGSMALHSRNGNGIWEPKVASGYGYVVRADPYKDLAFGTSGVGIPAVVDVSLVDTVKPSIRPANPPDPANPFYIQRASAIATRTGTTPRIRLQSRMDTSPGVAVVCRLRTSH